VLLALRVVNLLNFSHTRTKDLTMFGFLFFVGISAKSSDELF